MTTETFLEMMNSGEKILCGSEAHRYMGRLSQEAMKITARMWKKHPYRKECFL